MQTKKEIVEIVFNCIKEMNQQNGVEIPQDINTKLYGGECDLDSLGLVNLIVSIEENINITYGVGISIVDEKAMSQKHSPFRSVGTLVDYIMELLKEK